MSFTARTQPLAARTQSFVGRTHAKLADLNRGDGVRTSRPTHSEARQLLAIVGGTVVFLMVVLSLAFVALMAR